MISHRRAPATHNRKFARVPAGIRLHPRFSPTAIYPGMTETDLEPTPTSTPPSVTPPSTPVTTSGPVTTPNPVKPPPRPVTTTPAANRPVTPVVPTTTATTIPPTVAVPTVLPTTTEGAADAVLSTPTTTTPLTSVVVATPVSNGGTTTSLLTPLSTLSRNVAPALGTSSSSAAIASSSAAPDSGPSSSSTGAIVGGIGAGLVGVALVVFGVFYAVRRWRKRSDENAFDPDSFRRSAVLMNDPPTHEDTVSRGYNPRPPSMIERKLANSTPVNAGYGGPHGGYGATGYNNYGSFGPGEVMSPPPTSGSPDYHYNNNAASYNAVSPYAQSPFTPASPGSPHVAPYDSAYSHVAGVGAAGVLNRQLSAGPVHGDHFNRVPSYGPDDRQGHASLATVSSAPQGDYVDLTRSSVSPYQATQYAEISKQLNTAVPAGLSTPAVNQYMDAVAAEPSPFADPEPSRFSRALPSPYDQPAPSPSSDLEFPAPPTPAAVQHARVDSIPPSLPEIHVQARVSGYDDFNGQKDRFPTTPVPSPLASSLTFEAPTAAVAPAQGQPPAANEAPKAPQPSAPAPVQRPTPPASDRPATVYDEGDAYGGF
ncbi:hypothetical protein PTI98_008075 [Pleurotus ostreatus]|nr:hypothetical protein PTI98_008075 [Pleurotus ostreatus]